MPSATDYRQPGRSALQVSPICLAALDLRLDADGDARLHGPGVSGGRAAPARAGQASPAR